MQMQLASSAAFPEPLLAAMPQLREKPRLGFSSKNLALHQGHEVCNSTTALGFRAALHLERIRSRYTGKERDIESGNDYFGARYYSSSMGRFMSPDWSAKMEPVPYAKLDNPQSLNLYAYVGNNPLIRIDKDGHYYCKGSDPQCAKIADGIKQANAALASGKLSKVESGRLKGALDFLGKSTDMNGVIIKFDSKLQNSELADTHVTTQDIGGGKSMQITTITFNSKALNSNSDVGVGETAVHEATHGIDGKNRGGRDPLFKSEELQTERNAYRNQNYVHEGLGLPSPYGPGGDDVEAGAQRSTAEFCRTGGAC
jgi:RHS repeat-associated protein